jgi:hypothetical protein
MLRWWKARRRRDRALEESAEEWLARHGRHARTLARLRSLDAYLLGDLAEQERWGRIREMIDEREGTDAFSTPDSELPPKRRP